eukprot:TRINITY_DN6356_c0_g1_i8.p1 TRINITY_DN6356_c0_g1~~TRINITY_DN6356_c0_g1_i8.p1  ORF type:complete len:388 (-),score=108.22 TRINITY_DN6356_c0_g1_i8:1204-2367(-)
MGAAFGCDNVRRPTEGEIEPAEVQVRLEPYIDQRLKICPLIDEETYHDLLEGFDMHSTLLSFNNSPDDCYLLLPRFVQLVSDYVSKEIRNAMDAAVKLSCEAAADVHVKVLREAKAIQVARDVQRGLMSDPTDDNLSDKEKRRIADAEWAAALAEIKKMWDTARDKLFADYVCPATKKIATNLFASVSGKSTEMNFPDFVHLIERLLYARNSTQAVQSFLQCFNIADFNAVPRAELYRAFTLPLTLYRILIHLRAMDRDQLGAHRTALDQKIDQSAEDQEYRKARTEELKGAEERIELWESFSRFLGLQTVANCSETVGIEQLVGEGNPLFNWRVKIDAQEMFERLTSESSGNLTQLDTREIRRLFQNPRTQHIWDLTGCWPMQLPQ